MPIWAGRPAWADDVWLRVARELHDVVSHSIAIINFRAGVALHVLDRRPSEARDALEAILAGSAGAMHELRAALGVLRQGDGVELVIEGDRPSCLRRSTWPPIGSSRSP